MEHLLLKAAATVTEEGVFEAVISTATPDREGDIVRPAGMAAAMKKWADLGKLVPLAWVHTDEVVGHMDPTTVRVENNEVIAVGKIDLENPSEHTKDAWRLVKSGTLSFSFGYLIPDNGAVKRANGGLDIKDIDVFEISVVPIAPANNDTRVLAWKSLEERDRVLAELQEVKGRLDTLEKALAGDSSLDEALERIGEKLRPKETDETTKETKSRVVDPLQETAMKAALEVLTGGVTPPKAVTQEKPARVPELTPDEQRQQSRDLMVQVLTGTEVT